MKIINISGIYFKKKGFEASFCFEDLTQEEQEEAIKNFTNDELKRLCIHLAKSLKDVCIQNNIYYE